MEIEHTSQKSVSMARPTRTFRPYLVLVLVLVGGAPATHG